VAACGVPALLFSVAIANPCGAVQVSGFASPPPAPINQVPARDAATAQADNPQPARYMPPVHVAPAADQTAQPSRVSHANFDRDSAGASRDVGRQVSYSPRAAVTKLSDQSLSAADSNVSVAGHRAVDRFVGMHGFRNEPTPAAAPVKAQRIRRSGLQDHLSAAFKRTTQRHNAQPTEAVWHEDESAGADVEVVRFEEKPDEVSVDSTTFEKPVRHGSARASGSFKRKRLAARRQSLNSQPERIEDYQELLVRHEVEDDRLAVNIKQDLNRHRNDHEYDDAVYEDELNEPIEFATDYQRPMAGSNADRDSDQIDEEIMPAARTASVQANHRDRRTRVAQSARSRSQTLRGRQVSVLSSGRQDSDADGGSDFEEIPNRLRASRQIEKIDDFDPLNEADDELDDPASDDLDDLDRDIDAELKRLRERSGNDLDDSDDDDSVAKPPVKDCDTFRNELLNSSIRDIALDISPPASSLPGATYPVGRSWTDRSGNVIATGAMQDLRRGYVILDSGQKIAYARLSESDLAAVSEFWRLPTVCSVGDRGSVERNWIPQTFTWTASNLCHKTLFFENVQLERYGHSHGPFTQPIQSVAHFFVSLATVPYHAAIHPANECQYALGYYRPGNCAPWLKDPIPISLDGARRQALVATGLAVIP
jgi:hypothetical protein